MPLTLKITLDSPLCAGSGVARPGVVDRDVKFDENGLPFLAGRTLKGLLRDAYKQLQDCDCFQGLPEVDELFGPKGAESSGNVRVSNAILPAAPALSNWLGYAVREKHVFSREEVEAQYTTIRRQTAIEEDDPERRGAPKTNTLRATRVLNAGHIFEAPVSITLDQRGRSALALAAAALQQMGTARTRGLGNVSARLWEDGIDLTEKVLGEIQQNPVVYKTPGKPFQPVNYAVIPNPAGSADRPTHVMRFRITLNSPLLRGDGDGDPNMVRGDAAVAGSAIRGALACRALDDPEFYRLFCSGSLVFLGAYPEVDGKRASPIPHSVRLRKDGKGWIDFAGIEEEPDAPIATRRYGGWATLPAALAGQEATQANPTMQYCFHHARAGNRLVGRALGEKHAEYDLTAEKAGAVFTYQSLKAGTKLIGAVLGSEADLKKLIKLTAGAPIQIGRSRSAQYGGDPDWDWLDAAAPKAMAADGAEENGWAGGAQDPINGTVVRVTLLSPLVSRDEDTGYTRAQFPVKQLQENLGVTILEKDTKQFVRTTRAAGYLSHQRLPRLQETALAAGSTFVFHLSAPPDANKLAEARAVSYGARVEDGFGRIAITPLSGESKPRFKQETNGAEAPKNEACIHLARTIFQRRVQEHIRAEALRHAPTELSADLTNSLLHRILTFVESNPLDRLPSALDEIKRDAKGRLEKFRFRVDGAEFAMSDRLRKIATGHASMYRAIAQQVFNEGWQAVGTLDELQSSQTAKEMQEYLIAFLRAVLWRKRTLNGGRS